MGEKIQEIRYDQGWVLLIKEAKNIGLTQKEVRLLLRKQKQNH